MLNLTSSAHANSPNSSFQPDIILALPLVLWIMTSVLILTAGPVLYVLLISAFILQRNLRKGAGILIMNLIFIELMHSFLHFPFFIATVFLGMKGDYIQLHLCVHFTYLYLASIGAWNWCSCGLAVNRMIAVFKPYHYKAFATKSISLSIVATSWFICIVTTLPVYLVVVKSANYNRIVNKCNYTNFSSATIQEMPMAMGVFQLYLPLACIETLSLANLCELCMQRMRATRRVRSTAADNAVFPRGMFDRRCRLTRMVIAMTFFYFLCLLPMPIAVRNFPDWYSSTPLAQIWLRTLAFSGTMCNPVSDICSWSYIVEKHCHYLSD